MAGKSSGTKTFSFLGLAKLVHDAVGFSPKGLKDLLLLLLLLRLLLMILLLSLVYAHQLDPRMSASGTKSISFITG